MIEPLKPRLQELTCSPWDLKGLDEGVYTRPRAVVIGQETAMDLNIAGRADEATGLFIFADDSYAKARRASARVEAGGSFADELYRLVGFLDEGKLTPREFEVSKRILLTGSAEPEGSPMPDDYFSWLRKYLPVEIMGAY